MLSSLAILPFLTVVVTTVIAYRGDSLLSLHETRKCEAIRIDMCRGIEYNLTYMPNQFNHENQESAGLEVNQFMPLIKIECSKDLKFFLCSLYFPICALNYEKPLPPCRSVCQRAHKGCAGLMQQFGFDWPEQLNCDKLPVSGDPENLCMDDHNTTDQHHTTTTAPKIPFAFPDLPDTQAGKFPKGPKASAPTGPFLFDQSEPEVGFDHREAICQCDCVKAGFVESPISPVKKTVPVGNMSTCGYSCKSPYFQHGEENFTKFWIGLWSVLCCVSTLMTVTTFLIDMQRFRYPERPIIYLSFCYLMISIGYIVRLVGDHERVACLDEKMLRTSTTEPAICTVVFLLLYFFGMASSLWWVILSFTWFLAAGLKWSSEAIAQYAQYFHVVAWAIPTVKSVAVLAMSAVDGDPVAGVCFVGNTDLANLRGFVLTPLFAYLLVGSFFLFAGFISLFRIRNVIKQQGHNKIEKLEKLMIRIGIFSVLYTVPATIVIACLFYEQHYRHSWEMTRLCPCMQGGTEPDYSIFMLKYFMCLVVGITSGIWIWSHKTIESWRKFYRRLCFCGSRHNGVSEPIYQPAEAIIVKSHTDISSGYNVKYPLSHVWSTNAHWERFHQAKVTQKTVQRRDPPTLTRRQ